MKRILSFWTLLLVLFSGAHGLLLEQSAGAADQKSPSSSATEAGVAAAESDSRLSAGLAMVEQLRAFAGARKRVTLILRNGTTLSGTLTEVGNAQLVLGELTGKEFFDALVRIDDISALQVQTRRR